MWIEPKRFALSVHYRHSEPEHGMMLGYAGVSQEQARQGVERLRAAFEELDGLEPGAATGR